MDRNAHGPRLHGQVGTHAREQDRSRTEGRGRRATATTSNRSRSCGRLSRKAPRRPSPRRRRRPSPDPGAAAGASLTRRERWAGARNGRGGRSGGPRTQRPGQCVEAMARIKTELLKKLCEERIYLVDEYARSETELGGGVGRSSKRRRQPIRLLIELLGAKTHLFGSIDSILNEKMCAVTLECRAERAREPAPERTPSLRSARSLELEPLAKCKSVSNKCSYIELIAPIYAHLRSLLTQPG